MKVVREYKISVKINKLGGVMYNMITIVNNTVLYI